MYVSKYVLNDGRMDVGVDVCNVDMDIWIPEWMYGCMDVRTYGCMDVWMYGCMDVWMYGCVGMCMNGCMDFVYLFVGIWNGRVSLPHIQLPTKTTAYHEAENLNKQGRAKGKRGSYKAET